MVGRGVRYIRRRRGLSQFQLANLLETHQSYVSKIEKDQSVPSIKFTKRICDALEIPMSALFFFALKEDDVPKHNRGVFRIMQPSIKDYLFKLFGEDFDYQNDSE